MTRAILVVLLGYHGAPRNQKVKTAQLALQTFSLCPYLPTQARANVYQLFRLRELRGVSDNNYQLRQEARQQQYINGINPLPPIHHTLPCQRAAEPGGRRAWPPAQPELASTPAGTPSTTWTVSWVINAGCVNICVAGAPSRRNMPKRRFLPKKKVEMRG